MSVQDHAAALVARDASYLVETLADDRTLTVADPNVIKLDPGGSARTVTLPSATLCRGVMFEIVNGADADEALTVSDGATVGTIPQNRSAKFYCDGSDWALVAIYTIALA